MTPASPSGPRLWLLVLLPLVVQLGFVGLGAGLLQAAGLMDTEDTTLTNLPQAILLLSAYVVFGVAIWLVSRHFGEPRAVLALRRTPLLPALGLGALGLIAGVAISAALEPIFHGSASQQIEIGDISSASAVVAVALSAITVIGGAALTEELYFRGLLYGRLDARFGVASAVVGSAGVFGLVHFEPNAFPTLFALGLILGLLRMRTATIWPGVGVHALNNTFAILGLLLATR